MRLDNDKIKAAREKKHLTQEEAGKLAGLTKQEWWRYESGEVDNPRLDRVEAIARALNLGIEKLLRKEAKP